MFPRDAVLETKHYDLLKRKQFPIRVSIPAVKAEPKEAKRI